MHASTQPQALRVQVLLLLSVLRILLDHEYIMSSVLPHLAQSPMTLRLTGHGCVQCAAIICTVLPLAEAWRGVLQVTIKLLTCAPATVMDDSLLPQKVSTDQAASRLGISLGRIFPQ